MRFFYCVCLVLILPSFLTSCFLVQICFCGEVIDSSPTLNTVTDRLVYTSSSTVQ
jgi:hypothetical protein